MRYLAFLLTALSIVFATHMSFAADAVCARAIAFYPADGKGNADRTNQPIVIRVETQASTVKEANVDVINRGNTVVEAWTAKNKKSVSPALIIKKVSVKGGVGWDEIGCWTAKSHLATQYRAIVDSWPVATFPANPRAALPKVISPPAPVVPIDYLEDEQRRYRWVQVGNPTGIALNSCSVTVYYHEVPPPGDATSAITAGQSLTRDKKHVIGSANGSDENAKMAMRRWVRDELRKSVNGLPWHEDDISVVCGKE